MGGWVGLGWGPGGRQPWCSSDVWHRLWCSAWCRVRRWGWAACSSNQLCVCSKDRTMGRPGQHMCSRARHCWCVCSKQHEAGVVSCVRQHSAKPAVATAHRWMDAWAHGWPQHASWRGPLPCAGRPTCYDEGVWQRQQRVVVWVQRHVWRYLHTTRHPLSCCAADTSDIQQTW